MLRSAVDGLLGRSGGGGRSLRRDDRRSRGVSAWAFAAGVLIAFAGGYLLGGRFANPADARAGLRASVTGRQPGVVGEVEPERLAPQAFLVSAYPGQPEDEAIAHAEALARYLQSQGLRLARPYHCPTADGDVWAVAVYFDGENAKAFTRERLVGLPPDVPDETFVLLRNSDRDWPQARDIR